MLNWKILNSLPLSNECKGRIVGARVYADVPGNKCACGGKFTKRIPDDNEPLVKVPRCDQCNKLPPLFRIDADAIDTNGANFRVWIRNTAERTPQRLDKIAKVLTTLETIQREIKEGVFDVRNYDSLASQQKFVFKNYVVEYLKDYDSKVENREVTKKTLGDKKSLIDVHLIPFFGNMMLKDITSPVIRSHRKKHNTRRIHHLALAELRCILNHAVKYDMLVKAPDFDLIPRAKKRDEVMTTELAIKTIENVKGKAYQDLLRIMMIYPLRPGEARALRWKDITETHIHIRGHFSSNEWLEGRKSIRDGDKSKLRYRLTLEARRIFQEHKSNVLSIHREDDYIFKGANGPFIKKEALCHVWRVARTSVGHNHELYEIRHRCLTEYGKKSGGNIIKMMKFSGHTNPTTLMTRYIHDEEDLDDI